MSASPLLKLLLFKFRKTLANSPGDKERSDVLVPSFLETLA